MNALDRHIARVRAAVALAERHAAPVPPGFIRRAWVRAEIVAGTTVLRVGFVLEPDEAEAR